MYESRASPEKAIRQGYWNVSGAWGAEQCHITTLVPHSVHVDQWYWRGFVEPGMIGVQFVSYFFQILLDSFSIFVSCFFILFWYAFHMFYISFIYIYISIFFHWRALYSWSSPPKKYPCVYGQYIVLLKWPEAYVIICVCNKQWAENGPNMQLIFRLQTSISMILTKNSI